MKVLFIQLILKSFKQTIKIKLYGLLKGVLKVTVIRLKWLNTLLNFSGLWEKNTYLNKVCWILLCQRITRKPSLNSNLVKVGLLLSSSSQTTPASCWRPWSRQKRIFSLKISSYLNTSSISLWIRTHCCRSISGSIK